MAHYLINLSLQKYINQLPLCEEKNCLKISMIWSKIYLTTGSTSSIQYVSDFIKKSGELVKLHFKSFLILSNWLNMIFLEQNENWNLRRATFEIAILSQKIDTVLFFCREQSVNNEKKAVIHHITPKTFYTSDSDVACLPCLDKVHNNSFLIIMNSCLVFVDLVSGIWIVN